jgi:hypothetical protein
MRLAVQDRKSVDAGKGVAMSQDLGGGRANQKEIQLLMNAVYVVVVVLQMVPVIVMVTLMLVVVVAKRVLQVVMRLAVQH